MRRLFRPFKSVYALLRVLSLAFAGTLSAQYCMPAGGSYEAGACTNLPGIEASSRAFM